MGGYVEKYHNILTTRRICGKWSSICEHQGKVWRIFSTIPPERQDMKRIVYIPTMLATFLNTILTKQLTTNSGYAEMKKYDERCMRHVNAPFTKKGLANVSPTFVGGTVIVKD